MFLEKAALIYSFTCWRLIWYNEAWSHAENQQQGAVASDPGGSAVVGGNDSLINTDTGIEKIQVSVGLVNLAELYLIGFAVIIAAVGVSSVTVMRLKPREILSKMS